jgi:DNA-binding XRE family transcriptional regulator
MKLTKRETKRARECELAADMGTRLQALRMALGYDTTAAFARFLEVASSTVLRCERGQVMRLRTVGPLGNALCNKVGFTWDWFLGGTPQEKTYALDRPAG